MQTALAGRGALRRNDVHRMIAQHDLGGHEYVLGQNLAVVGASILRTRLQYGQVVVSRIQTEVGQHHTAAARDDLGVLVPEYDVLCNAYFN